MAWFKVSVTPEAQVEIDVYWILLLKHKLTSYNGHFFILFFPHDNLGNWELV
jgi:hypothetical protein